jgi:hypothetical protein
MSVLRDLCETKQPLRVAVDVFADETVRRQGRRRSSGQDGEELVSLGNTSTATTSYSAGVGLHCI